MQKDVVEDIIRMGRLLWDKDLATGLNGNISSLLNEESIFITGRKTCLGNLSPTDIVAMGPDGSFSGPREPSSEKRLHLDIYRHFPETRAIVHTHTTCTNAYFLKRDVFRPPTLEAEYVLGDVWGVDQGSINVEDTTAVIDRLKSNKIVVLRRHGVVCMGENLFDCFVKIQGLEEQIKLEAFSKIFER